RANICVGRGQTIALTGPVVMELLAGARSGEAAASMRDHLLTFGFLPVVGLSDYEASASIHRACRQAGEAVRSQIDCLIAAVAIRNGVPVLHADTDFDVIARHSELLIEPVTA